MTLRFPGPAGAIKGLKTFLTERALPLWNTTGFDEGASCFHERLSLTGIAQTGVPRRLMVQCRQIAVFARVDICGWYKDREQHALRAFETVRRNYHAPDGNPGWIFSLQARGTEVADATRDLYAHAFVLYMLAWLYRLFADPDLIPLVDETLSDVDVIFSVPGEPGMLSRVPAASDLREQNPHMHLFEALLALAEATGKERYLHRAGVCVELFDRVLVDSDSGAVRELFDAQWRPLQPGGRNLVEPGHQMEWAWLLREWQRLSGNNVDSRVQRLITHATAFGIDFERGIVQGNVLESGEVISSPSRVWQQTEAIRALCCEDSTGTLWPGSVSLLTENLLRNFLLSDLNGGWIDQLDPSGKPSVDYMPASTLYHLVGAAIDSRAICGDDNE